MRFGPRIGCVVGMAALLVLPMWGHAHAAEPTPAAQATCTTDDGSTCTIWGHHTVPNGTVLDYGDRNVVLAGETTLTTGPGPRHLTIRTNGDFLIRSWGRIGTENRAHHGRDGGDLTVQIGGSLTLGGRLDLEGHPNHGAGGRLTLKTGGTLTVAPWGAIFADGKTGGTLDLTVGGALDFSGRLKARGHSSHGDGGTIKLYVAGPAKIAIPARIRVDGARAGNLTLRAQQTLTLEGDLTATGRYGGTVTLDANGPATLGSHALLSLEGQGHHGKSGSLTISFCGPSASVAGHLLAVGEGSADGGRLTVQSRGPLTLTGRLKAWGEGHGATGGTIQVASTAGLTLGPHARLKAEGHPNGTITLAAPDPLEINGARIEPPYSRVPLGPICGISPLQFARANHTAILLRDGTVLLAGGRNGAGSINSLERFDPTTGSFATLAARLSEPREGHSATVLPDGRLLLLGGTNGTSVLDTADLFDPTTGTVAVLSSRLSAPRSGHTATLLLDGTVLISGGSDGTTVLETAVLFDPITGTFSALSARLSARRSEHTATLLPDGTVLLVGGSSDGTNSLDFAELFNPATQSFSALDSRLSTRRKGHTASLLPDGTALFLGGTSDGSTAIASGELFDPAAGAFRPAAQSLLRARREHTATLLGDGTLLGTGGFGSGPLPTAERLSLGLLDTTPPRVIEVRPPDNETDMPDDSRVAIRFSEPINPQTLSEASFRLIDQSTNQPINGTLAISEGALLAFFVPSDPLTSGRTYTIQLTEAIQDTSGNPLIPFTSSFTAKSPGGPLALLPQTLSLLIGEIKFLTVQLPFTAPAGGATINLIAAKLTWN